MLEKLKADVYAANLSLSVKGIVIYTWGNVSGIDREKGLVVIKPSGISYNKLSSDDMVVVDLQNGKSVAGKWKPSSDTKTHLELYRKYPNITSIAHTHSDNAVAFAQAGMSIPVLGTTHADYFYGNIPCTRELTEQEVAEEYEKNTGRVIIETISKLGYDPMTIPGIIVKNHGPFTWGTSPENAVDNAVIMEKIAEISMKTLALNPYSSIPQYVLDKHYIRKHGLNAYYGQNIK